jgi:hypothetical protein
MGYVVTNRDDNKKCKHCTELTLLRARCPGTGVYASLWYTIMKRQLTNVLCDHASDCGRRGSDGVSALYLLQKNTSREPNLTKETLQSPKVAFSSYAPGYYNISWNYNTTVGFDNHWQSLDDPRETVGQWIVDNQRWMDERVNVPPALILVLLQEGLRCRQELHHVPVWRY